MQVGQIKRFFVGEPLTNQMASHERIPKWKALAVMASDALSSTAYATEEILLPLAAFSVLAMSWSMPIALGITTLLVIVSLSYLQTIEAYPGGGGAYTVAKENLGTGAGLVAGAALLLDYVLTVSVSVAAGMANFDSAFPFLQSHRVAFSALVIFIIMVLNLRGIRESATVFAFPTYFFIISFFSMLGVGAWKVLTGQAVAAAPILHETYPELSLFLILRAFSSGCAALSGIEAISNGVTSFRAPEARNAKITLIWMALILAVLFMGTTLLAHVYGVSPREGETIISQLSRSVFGDTLYYYILQFATALILFLAANTAYTGFPSLASMLAKDRFLPRQLASLGDRLVFSNGILGLSFFAFLLIWLFDGDVHKLIPLYAIGVFLSFTLSQSGMVIHHLKLKKPGWISGIAINSTGAVTTLIVLGVVATTKFTHGAWMVILIMPFIVYTLTRIHAHYLAVGKELSLLGATPPGALSKLKHTVVVPISGIHRGVIDALRYAVSISDDVRACYVEIDPETTERVKEEWMKWAHEVPFVVLKSPYRSVIRPLLEYIDDVAQCTHDDMVTVIIPEFVTSKWRYNLLHNQTALLIRTALLFKRGKVVTSVRYHLKN
jgi:amino acid transporter